MSILWDGLQAAATEAGALDPIDRSLLDNLAARAGLPDGDPAEEAFRAVVACLAATTRSGGLRIPSDPVGLAARLEAWLAALPPAPVPEPPSGAAPAAALADLARRLAAEFLSALATGRYSPIAGGAGDFLPLIADRGGLYFQKHHAAEALAGARLKALLDAPDPAFPPGSLGNVLDTVLDKVPLRLGAAPGAAPMEFDAGQKAALSLALRKRFAVVSGGPGTGKTSLAANFLRGWIRLREGGPEPRIRLAAPTGRAAQRLSESIRRSLATLGPDPAPADACVRDLECGTLHSLLRYHPGTGGFFHGAARPLPADLVLVDEASMVDIFLLARLADSLEPGACLVLLGDMDQLPSVEAGSILADLAPAGAPADHPLRDNLAVLSRSHRSDAGILDAARRINALDGAGALAGLAAPMRPDGAQWPIAFLEGGRPVAPGGGCRMLLPPGGEAGAGDAAWRAGRDAWLESWVDFHYLGHAQDPSRFPGRVLAEPRRASYEALIRELCGLGLEAPGRDALLAEAFAYLDQARILTFTRKGWHGAAAINRAVGERLMRRWDPRARDAAAGFPGMPVLILENDTAKGLFNGDVGLRLRMEGRDVAWFRRGDGFERHPAAFLPRHEAAFAMTVHKSQGSEYDQVLLVLPEAGNRLLYKETLYTALTRARRFAAVYGPPAVFLEAAGRRIHRESGLAGYLADPPR